MSIVKGAIKRLKQRSKLPMGDRVVTRKCDTCDTPIWLWNDAPVLNCCYKLSIRCSYCKQAERAYNAGIFGGTR